MPGYLEQTPASLIEDSYENVCVCVCVCVDVWHKEQFMYRVECIFVCMCACMCVMYV